MIDKVYKETNIISGHYFWHVHYVDDRGLNGNTRCYTMMPLKDLPKTVQRFMDNAEATDFVARHGVEMVMYRRPSNKD